PVRDLDVCWRPNPRAAGEVPASGRLETRGRVGYRRADARRELRVCGLDLGVTLRDERVAAEADVALHDAGAAIAGDGVEEHELLAVPRPGAGAERHGRGVADALDAFGVSELETPNFRTVAPGVS